ncbi:MAG: tRNA (guanosine(46)-N7)-methyltransferase TrmB [Acidiferrobacteraceae bacterium]|nr:tRNA (guanosine(46)-N7)-methyltransferase TrmB [Acidiferrobacteraceae bacterium]
MNDLTERPVRSFVRREGRMTAAQKRALEKLWPVYGIDVDRGLAGKLPAPRNGRVTLEIGFGDGEALLALAKQSPQGRFIGIDPHRPGAGRLLLQLEREEVENVRLIIGDAAELVPSIESKSLTQILVLFPDPWPKKRHHKRRLLTPEFLRILGEKLQPQGGLHIATDWHEYAEEILNALDETPNLCNEAGRLAFCARPDWRPVTKYKQRGLRLGHQVFDIAGKRI